MEDPFFAEVAVRQGATTVAGWAVPVPASVDPTAPSLRQALREVATVFAVRLVVEALGEAPEDPPIPMAFSVKELGLIWSALLDRGSPEDRTLAAGLSVRLSAMESDRPRVSAREWTDDEWLAVIAKFPPESNPADAERWIADRPAREGMKVTELKGTLREMQEGPNVATKEAGERDAGDLPHDPKQDYL